MGFEQLKNIFKGPSEGAGQEQEPVVRYKIIRHAERLATGQLSEEGISQARRLGGQLQEAEVVKGYSSQEKSDRAYQTVKSITEASRVTSGLTGKTYETRRRPGLFYDLAGPLTSRVEAYSQMINEAVKKDYPDFDSKSSDPKWAKIRKEYQPFALKKIIAHDPELTHIFAMGAAHQLAELSEIGSRYSDYRQKKAVSGAEPINRDIVLMEGTHGGFLESMLKKALIRRDGEGREKLGFQTHDDEKGNPEFEASLGGVFRPGESFEAVQKLGQATDSRLPIAFEDNRRFAGEQCFLDMQRIRKLAGQFEEYADAVEIWKKNGDDKKLVELLDGLRNAYAQQYEADK